MRKEIEARKILFKKISSEIHCWTPLSCIFLIPDKRLLKIEIPGPRKCLSTQKCHVSAGIFSFRGEVDYPYWILRKCEKWVKLVFVTFHLSCLFDTNVLCVEWGWSQCNSVESNKHILSAFNVQNPGRYKDKLTLNTYYLLPLYTQLSFCVDIFPFYSLGPILFSPALLPFSYSVLCYSRLTLTSFSGFSLGLINGRHSENVVGDRSLGRERPLEHFIWNLPFSFKGNL